MNPSRSITILLQNTKQKSLKEAPFTVRNHGEALLKDLALISGGAPDDPSVTLYRYATCMGKCCYRYVFMHAYPYRQIIVILYNFSVTQINTSTK